MSNRENTDERDWRVEIGLEVRGVLRTCPGARERFVRMVLEWQKKHPLVKGVRVFPIRDGYEPTLPEKYAGLAAVHHETAEILI